MSINVFTYNRIEGLVRLLNSLDTSDYMGRTDIPMILYFDFTKNASEPTPKERRDILELIERNGSSLWRHGPLRVHRRAVNAGLKSSIMESWYPMNDDEVVAFFEDDLEVSPHWFRWTAAAMDVYGPSKANPAGPHPKNLGLALYRPIFDQLSQKDVPVDSGDNPFLLQQPCSWGSVFFPKPWREFRNWFEEHRHEKAEVMLSKPRILRPLSNKWDTETSWKKSLIKLMYERGWFMVYPNFPKTRTLSTNHLMVGVHSQPKVNTHKYILPLVVGNDHKEVTKVMGNLPPLQEMHAYDMMFNRVDDMTKLPNYYWEKDAEDKKEK